MTSDERRKVAENLRKIDKAWPTLVDDLEEDPLRFGGLAMAGILACIDGRAVFRRLADLIDPTCQNDGDEWGFLCSKCGELVSITKEVPCGCGEAPYIPYYCPSCGARVVNCHE